MLTSDAEDAVEMEVDNEGGAVFIKKKKTREMINSALARILRQLSRPDKLTRERIKSGRLWGGTGHDCYLYSKEGVAFPVNKAVVARCCLKLKSILKSGPYCCCCKTDIFLPDVSTRILGQAIKFIYTGAVDASFNERAELKTVLLDMFGLDNVVVTTNARPEFRFECVYCGDMFTATTLYDHYMEKIQKYQEDLSVPEFRRRRTKKKILECILCKTHTIDENKENVEEHFKTHKVQLRNHVKSVTGFEPPIEQEQNPTQQSASQQAPLPQQQQPQPPSQQQQQPPSQQQPPPQQQVEETHVLQPQEQPDPGEGTSGKRKKKKKKHKSDKDKKRRLDSSESEHSSSCATPREPLKLTFKYPPKPSAATSSTQSVPPQPSSSSNPTPSTSSSLSISPSKIVPAKQQTQATLLKSPKTIGKERNQSQSQPNSSPAVTEPRKVGNRDVSSGRERSVQRPPLNDPHREHNLLEEVMKEDEDDEFGS